MSHSGYKKYFVSRGLMGHQKEIFGMMDALFPEQIRKEGR
jgi:hypothetical protein